MLHIDTPTRSDLERLIRHRAPACVSIYLPTTPLTHQAQADRTALSNLADEALAQLSAAGHDKRLVAEIQAHVEALIEADDFWATQANSLAVFATPERLVTFRLADRLQPAAEVADRFHIKPLLRAATGAQEAFVLAMAQGSVRLIEVAADMPPLKVAVPDLPKDLSDAVGRGSLDSRSARGRIQGSEGKKVRLAQYARAVDSALRAFLAGRETPLILAATAPLDSIFRASCTYPHLLEEGVTGNPESVSDSELASAVRHLVDQYQARELAAFGERFEQRGGAGRTTTDVAQAARAATFGAIAEIAVNIDVTVPGTVDDEDGSIVFADAPSALTHGIVDEIAGRVLLAGGRVLPVRRGAVPGGGDLAAIFRYAF